MPSLVPVCLEEWIPVSHLMGASPVLLDTEAPTCLMTNDSNQHPVCRVLSRLETERWKAALPVYGYSHVIKGIPRQHSACLVSIAGLQPNQRSPQSPVADLYKH